MLSLGDQVTAGGNVARTAGVQHEIGAIDQVLPNGIYWVKFPDGKRLWFNEFQLEPVTGLAMGSPFTDTDIARFKAAIRETVRTGVEVGFVICEGSPVFSRVCTGDSCGVLLEDCAGRKARLMFHTHPTTGVGIQEIFSETDLQSAFKLATLHDLKYTIIGYLQDDRAKIFYLTGPQIITHLQEILGGIATARKQYQLAISPIRLEVDHLGILLRSGNIDYETYEKRWNTFNMASARLFIEYRRKLRLGQEYAGAKTLDLGPMPDLMMEGFNMIPFAKGDMIPHAKPSWE